MSCASSLNNLYPPCYTMQIRRHNFLSISYIFTSESACIQFVPLVNQAITPIFYKANGINQPSFFFFFQHLILTDKSILKKAIYFIHCKYLQPIYSHKLHSMCHCSLAAIITANCSTFNSQMQF